MLGYIYEELSSTNNSFFSFSYLLDIQRVFTRVNYTQINYFTISTMYESGGVFNMTSSTVQSGKNKPDRINPSTYFNKNLILADDLSPRSCTSQNTGMSLLDKQNNQIKNKQLRQSTSTGNIRTRGRFSLDNYNTPTSFPSARRNHASFKSENLNFYPMGNSQSFLASVHVRKKNLKLCLFKLPEVVNLLTIH